MSKSIGRNQNISDDAAISIISINDATSTTLSAANPRRVFFYVSNNSASAEAWIKLQAASVDNDKKGIFLGKKADPPRDWTMMQDTPYTGEISGISESGTHDVYLTEYIV